MEHMELMQPPTIGMNSDYKSHNELEWESITYVSKNKYPPVIKRG